MVHLDPAQPHPYQLKDDPCTVVNRLIFKIVSVQEFFILVLKFKEFLKNILNVGLCPFFKNLGPTRITQYIYQDKVKFSVPTF